ncbi:alpha/beta hydrolase [Nocardia speluncae]|uniref:Alpha/beta hydrolase n=1 Tax=Nocardia speluncae TaxID=419477 RepID=A0A846XDR5_9NOCA|nr:alpha/beta hydrolase [Nocardia speluncae]NKY32880.1 alpha/beta hydrolase [Nocardia speluncae]
MSTAALWTVTSCSTLSSEELNSSYPTLAHYESQTLDFAPCDQTATGIDDDRVECATLEVPLDYSSPDGPAIELGISRIRATGTDRVGSVVVNPGGPGAPSVGFVTAVADSWADGPARQQFDIVSMDPRGVGTSRPAIDCYTDQERDDDAIVSGIPAGALAWTADSARSVLEQCARRSGGMDVLGQMSTENAARDLDVLRAALGDEQLTFLGASYGTRLGTIYAQQFPSRVRAMVLDGAVDPRKNVLERQTQLFAGVQRSFDELSRYCVDRGNCPLGSDLAGTVGAIQSLLRPLLDTPAPTAGGRRLTYFAAIEAVTLGLYSSQAWDSVIAGLAELRAGRADVMLALRDVGAQRGPDGTYTNSSEATLAINCLDEIRPTPEQTTAVVAEVNSLAPYMDPGFDVDTHYGCEGWPDEQVLDYPYGDNITGLPETLVVSVTGDGLTPHEGGVALSEMLGARLLTVDGEQHGATTAANACINEIVEHYLVDLTIPDNQLRCVL